MLGAVFLLTSCSSSHDTDDAPYLILVLIDGFGWDFRQQADTPALDEIAARGVSAQALRPVFPTTTFPNHYSIATGLYPYEHGIVGNSFPNDARTAWYRLSDREAVQDGAWYRGEPIWVTAEKAGLKSAAYYFVGTEAPIAGVLPTYWRSFDADVPGGERVAQVLRWLQLPARHRPHLVTLYFEDVDDAAHATDPEARRRWPRSASSTASS